MGFLKTNYENTGFGTLPVGEYEVVISEAKMKTSSNGNEMISVTLTVRDDVDQPMKKRKIFDNLMLMESMNWKLQQVAKAVGVPEGHDFETPAEFAEYIQYKAVRVKIKHEQYNGEAQARVERYMPPTIEGGESVGTEINIGDDDLPF